MALLSGGALDSNSPSRVGQQPRLLTPASPLIPQPLNYQNSILLSPKAAASHLRDCSGRQFLLIFVP